MFIHTHTTSRKRAKKALQAIALHAILFTASHACHDIDAIAETRSSHHTAHTFNDTGCFHLDDQDKTTISLLSVAASISPDAITAFLDLISKGNTEHTYSDTEASIRTSSPIDIELLKRRKNTGLIYDQQFMNMNAAFLKEFFNPFQDRIPQSLHAMQIVALLDGLTSQPICKNKKPLRPTISSNLYVPYPKIHTYKEPTTKQQQKWNRRAEKQKGKMRNPKINHPQTYQQKKR